MHILFCSLTVITNCDSPEALSFRPCCPDQLSLTLTSSTGYQSHPTSIRYQVTLSTKADDKNHLVLLSPLRVKPETS